MGLARFLSVYHTLVHIKLQLSVMIAPFLEQALHLNSFKQLGGRSNVFPEFCLY